MNGTANTTPRTSPNCANKRAGEARDWRGLRRLV
jgi:hypothetical protein